MFLRAGASVVVLAAAAAAVRSPGAAAPCGDGARCDTSLVERAAAASGRMIRHRLLTLKAVARCMSADYHTPRTGGSKRIRTDCGEDAYFIAAPNARAVSVGIADGVGGWSLDGIDAGEFAWELMNTCQDVAQEESPAPEAPSAAAAAAAGPPHEAGAASPRKLLAACFNKLRLGQAEPPIGSSTACVATLERHSGLLRIANLGDSGAFVIRAVDGELALESTVQQHKFNWPYQLMVPPVGETGGDPPEDADEYVVQVQEGDIVVLATDGLFDNIPKDLLMTLTAALRSADLGAVAEELVNIAHLRSQSPEETPFSMRAQTAGVGHDGGKPDDITVIVARVERSPPEAVEEDDEEESTSRGPQA